VIEVAGNAVLVAMFRHGTSVKGKLGLIWGSNGTRGGMRVEAPGSYLMSEYPYEWACKGFVA
jgi:hypothetical protein